MTRDVNIGRVTLQIEIPMDQVVAIVLAQEILKAVRVAETSAEIRIDINGPKMRSHNESIAALGFGRRGRF